MNAVIATSTAPRCQRHGLAIASTAIATNTAETYGDVSPPMCVAISISANAVTGNTDATSAFATRGEGSGERNSGTTTATWNTLVARRTASTNISEPLPK